MASPYEVLPTPIKGKADWREFRAIRLNNGVTICLVHDRESKTTAAASTVEAGAASDPIPGLAHFCEHMCFLGSEKYPEENEYKSYLSKHGGTSNASTSMHNTTYKFEVLANYAPKALDMFAHFFTDPLFTVSGTSREVNAVDSENSKNLVADVRRRLQIFKDLTDPKHYYSKFSTGNAETLKHENIRDLLLAFHRKHYRPDRLTLVVAGPQTLEELETLVVPLFESMKVREFKVTNEVEAMIERAAADAPPTSYREPQPQYCSPLQPDNTWPFLITTKPIQSVRRLVLSFPMPPVYYTPDQSPTSVLSHLLGHEGPSSSFAVLQDANLISSLSAGCRVIAPDFTIFQLDLHLTEPGEQRWKEVVDVLFQHARIILNADESKLRRIWTEEAELSKVFFDQTSPGGVYSLAPRLAQNIISDGTAKCLSAGNRLEENADTFPLSKVREFASLLKPENCIIERCSVGAWEEMEQRVEDPSVKRKSEKWYGVEYFQATLDSRDIDRWAGRDNCFFKTDSLDLPRPNRFIPRALDLCDELPEEARLGPRIDKAIDPPKILIDATRAGRLWHRLDDRYALPKSVVTLLIRNAAIEQVKKDGIWQPDVASEIRSLMLASIFRESLAQETYDASLAGLQWSLSASQGLNLTCNGFSDRLPDLAKKLLQEFLSGQFIKESYFEAAKDRLTRNLKLYFSSRRADSLAVYYRDFLLSSSDEGIPASLVEAEACTFESLKAHHKNILANEETMIDCLFTGNVSSIEAKSFFNDALSTFENAAYMARQGAENVWIPGNAERRLGTGEEVHLHFQSQNKDEENGSVVMTFQSSVPGYRGPKGEMHGESLQSSSSIRLICQMLREPLFDELRTKQTLGYVVSSSFEQGFSYRPPDQLHLPHFSTPVDKIMINVLSRKLSPVQITERIDDFLVNFRKTLKDMPESEFQNHTHALSTKLRKPIQKLNQEASLHLSLIRRYGTEAEWNLAEALADQVEKLTQDDVLNVWDRLTSKTTRSRVVSHVYGTTFPLDRSAIPKSSWKRTVIIDDLEGILLRRKRMPVFRPEKAVSKTWLWGTVAVTAATVGVVSWTLWRSKKR